MNLTLQQAAAAMNAVGDIDQDTSLNGVATDSRVVAKGDLFFCLSGDNFDGHNFAAAAASGGAVGIVASRPLPEVPDGTAVLMVRDVLEALGALGAYWRQQAKATVIAVTGSAGKTTVKEMLAAILSRLGETAKNYKNFNNQIGVPGCMLGCSGQERFWVLELGISLPGDMDELGAMVRPDVAVINNIGPAHLEGLGSLDGVARAKSDLLRYLAPGGKAFVCRDYPLLWEHSKENFAGVRAVTAQGGEAAYAGQYLGPDESGMGRFRLTLPGESVELSAAFTGAYFAENMIAAAAVAHTLGAGPEDIAAGILAASVPEHRFEVRTQGAWTVVDDCYNANPLSMARALDNVSEMAAGQPLVLALGEMRELGPQAAALHHELGQHVAKTGAKAVFFHGDFAAEVMAGLEQEHWAGTFERIDQPEAFAQNFMDLGLEKGLVLFKGSRGCRMELYVRALAQAMGA